MDRIELIEKIYSELQIIKQRDKNNYATINEYDEAIFTIIPFFQKIKNSEKYDCYRTQIIRAIKLRLEEKDAIKAILLHFAKECL